MRSELRPLVRALGAKPAQLGTLAVHVGRAGRAEVTAALIGVGPAAARASTERLLDAGRFDHVVVSGIAGGIGPGGSVGDSVAPEVVEDLASGRRFTPPPFGDRPRAGVLVTTGELIMDDDHIRSLVARGVVALDMETSAV